VCAAIEAKKSGKEEEVKTNYEAKKS